MTSEPSFSLAGYTFLASKGCTACKHVLAGDAVLLFVHGRGGSLQFLCGAEGHESDDAVWLHVTHVLDLHPDLDGLPPTDFGFEAERLAAGQPWTLSPLPDDY